jgi:hypothetical protein
VNQMSNIFMIFSIPVRIFNLPENQNIQSVTFIGSINYYDIEYRYPSKFPLFRFENVPLGGCPFVQRNKSSIDHKFFKYKFGYNWYDDSGYAYKDYMVLLLLK